MRKIESTLARQEFSDTLNQVAYGQDRIVLSRHGKDVAALVPMVDLALLKQCEETLGKRGARPPRKAAAAGPARKGGSDTRRSGRRQGGRRSAGTGRPGRRRRS
jgi:prevent-host-death family protein